MKALGINLGQAAKANFPYSTKISVCRWVLAKNSNTAAQGGSAAAANRPLH